MILLIDLYIEKAHFICNSLSLYFGIAESFFFQLKLIHLRRLRLLKIISNANMITIITKWWGDSQPWGSSVVLNFSKLAWRGECIRIVTKEYCAHVVYVLVECEINLNSTTCPVFIIIKSFCPLPLLILNLPEFLKFSVEVKCFICKLACGNCLEMPILPLQKLCIRLQIFSL